MTLEAPAIESPIDSEWSESLQLMRAIELTREGDLQAVRSLLVEICRRNRDSELGWLWLASVAKSPSEGLECIKHVLRINPENKAAHDWLRKFSEKHASPSGVAERSEPAKQASAPDQRPLGKMSDVVARLRQQGKLGASEATPETAPVARRVPTLLKVARSSKPTVTQVPAEAAHQDATSVAEVSPLASLAAALITAQTRDVVPPVVEPDPPPWLNPSRLLPNRKLPKRRPPKRLRQRPKPLS